MGIVILKRDLLAIEQSGLPKPIIYCHPDRTDLLNAISLNKELAKKILLIEPNRRTLRIEKCLQQVLKQLPDDSIVKDFDVLFNPDYKVDILLVLSTIAKTKPYRIIWPGGFDGKRLYYAEEGFPDYRSFDIRNYDITCVV